MKFPRFRPRDDEELEVEVRISRNVPLAPTRRDIDYLERKKLGPSWGKPRRKLRGWPR